MKLTVYGSEAARTGGSMQNDIPTNKTMTNLVDTPNGDEKPEKDAPAIESETPIISLNITKKDYKSEIIGELAKLISIYQAAGDRMKAMGYRRTISNIKAFPGMITCPDDMNGIKHVGPKIKQKVKELIEDGKMTKLQNLQSDGRLLALEELTQIWGIGTKIAEKLFASGIKNVADLQEEVEKNPNLLTGYQKIGLKYVKDFNERMPREEAAVIAETVKREALNLFGENIQVQACGSYRRGRPTCGDVDCLVTRLDNKLVAGMLEPLLKRLEAIGFLKERLQNTQYSAGKDCETYMGVCQVPNGQYARRIDIKVYPKEKYGFALLYFTGSDYFNRSMRMFAEKKGYTLSEHGLVPLNEKGQKNPKRMTIPCQTEEEVFVALGLPYKTPQERDL